MQKKTTAQDGGNATMDLTPLVAASLAGTIYQAKLYNRQARMTVPEDSIVAEVIGIWREVMKKAGKGLG